MTQLQRHQERKIGFRSVKLFKDRTLGIGYYGAVCKAKCDDLLCAAKILHPTLFDPTVQLQVPEHRLPIKRFEQECEFLSTIRHPNIIQYLCMHQDPDTGLPVLLMELMDESLTHFLESSPQPIIYHIQINVCHDITLALSFLHSNGIVHRDLSSNNVLLRGNTLAKVTDFGMAKLGDLNPQATCYTFTTCPGTDVYMPPEAIKDEPVYNEKIDCFSFGVITIQILTQQFPKPGDRLQEVETAIGHPGLPQDQVAIRVAEVDRRQNHISQVDPNHPLLPIALGCLKDKDTERPSAQQLCERVASLKERPEYSNSVASAQQERQLQQRKIEEKGKQLQQLREKLEQLQQRIIREREGKEMQIEELRQQLQQLRQSSAREREEALRQMRQQLCQLIEEKERQREQLLAAHGKEIKRITNIKESQLKSIERERNEAEKQLYELEEQLQARDREKDTQLKAANYKVAKRDNVKLRWRERLSALFADSRRRDAVVDGNQVYILDSNCHLWNYDINSKRWLQLAKAPYVCPGFAILDGLPTTIGGIGTNKLMSLTVGGIWTKKFPPMLTKRYFVSAVCTGTDLIVAGGIANNSKILTLTTVEVLNIKKYQWSTAVDLPEPLQHHSVTVCGDQLYMLGGARGHVSTKSVYTCSVSALLQTCTQTPQLVGSFQHSLSRSNSSSAGVWSKLPDLPVRESTCVTLCGKLLAVGGEDSNSRPTTAVYMYNQDTSSWSINSHMITRRQRPFAAVLPNNQLMVVGGETEIDGEWAYSDSVEFGNLC